MADVVDFSPLERDPTSAEVARARAQARRGTYGKATKQTARGPDGAVVVAALVVSTLLVLLGVVGLVQSVQGDPAPSVLVLVTVVVLALACLTLWASRRAGRRSWQGTTRLLLFAAANPGFAFQPHARASSRPPPVLDDVTGRAVLLDRMTWTAARAPVQAGHVHVSGRGGRNGDGNGSTTVRYLAVHLDLDLPEDETTDRPRALFDEPVVALLEEREVPASYADGWFVAVYPAGDRSDPGTWRHRVALAQAVATAARRARG